MSHKPNRTTTRHPARTGAPSYWRGARKRPTEAQMRSSPKAVSTEFGLQNSTVTIEYGPAGAIARVEVAGEEGYSRYYAGPLPAATINALHELSEEGGE